MSPVSSSSFFFAPVASYLQECIGFAMPRRRPVDDIWQAEEAVAALNNGKIRSLDEDDDDDNDDDNDNDNDNDGSNSYTSSDGSSNDNDNLRILFRNESPATLLLCWVSKTGDLHHFYPLPPSTTAVNGDTIIDVGNAHIEYSSIGHAFCLAYVKNKEDLIKIQKSKSLFDHKEPATVIAGYRPIVSSSSSSLSEEDQDRRQFQMVTISHVQPVMHRLRPLPWCLGKRRREPPSNDDDDDGNGNDEQLLDLKGWRCTARWVRSDSTPLDTTTKFYEEKVLGGWACRVEPNCFDGDRISEQKLERDIQAAAMLLPSHARQFLRSRCKIWINKSISWGPKSCPVKGHGCCYHPNKEWLLKNGLSGDKYMCVEINDAPFYRSDCDLWGVGGIMLHESSHAYHHGMIADGYSNKEIQLCFDLAMKEGLYDSVKVKGSQGLSEAEAYACTNSMEYFAELSTAFLGGLDGESKYNKWFPFNRQELATHDPRAYALLSRLWKVDIQMSKT